MRKALITIIMLLFLSPAFASDDLSYLLNKVVMHMSAEQWVTTSTALVTVDINASVKDTGIDAVQTNVKKNLTLLSNKSEWHITSLVRNTDRSGLESIEIHAEARLPQTDLAAIRKKAENLSKPGEKYKILSIEFTPSEAEIKQANENLRENIYGQVKTELARLNKTYPGQRFYVHEVDFINYPETLGMSRARKSAGTEMLAMAAMSPEMDVGNKLTLKASVILGSMNAE